MSKGRKNMEAKRMHAIKKVFILERRVESVCFMLYPYLPTPIIFNFFSKMQEVLFETAEADMEGFEAHHYKKFGQ
jgi:hypothetical protein